MGNVAGFTGSRKEDLAAAKQAFDAAQAFDKSYFKPRVGANKVRLIKIGDGTGIDIVQRHFVSVMVDGQEQRRQFACLRAHSKSACPACERAQHLRQLGDPASMDAAKKWDPKPAAYIAVIDRAAEHEGPKSFAVGQMLFADIMALSEGEDGFELFDPEAGHDLIIKRTGSGQNDTRYSVTVAKSPSVLGTDEQLEEWQHRMPDINRIAGFMDYESASRLIGGETGGRQRAALPPRQPAAQGQIPGPRSTVARPTTAAPAARPVAAAARPAAAPAARPNTTAVRRPAPPPPPTEVVEEGYGDEQGETTEYVDQ